MTEPIQIPDWIATLVGRLVLQNELLRLTIANTETENSDNENKS